MVAVVAGFLLHLTVAVSGFFLALIDAREHRLPDRGTYSTAVVVGVLAVCQNDAERLHQALSAGVVSGLFFWLLAVLPSRPLGLGDVKLQVVLGFYLGWWSPVLVLIQVFGAFALGGVVALWWVVRGRMEISDPIAFGPAMIVATWLAIVFWKSSEII